MPAFLVAIRGKVQGVYFRSFTQQAAQAHAVTGWVRNMPDGSVQAHLQHHDEQVLRELLGVLAGGPPSAQVESVMHSRVPEEQCQGFTITH